MSTPPSEVLILTQDFDPTVDPAVRSLTAKGVRVVRVDIGDFPLRLCLRTSDFDGRRLLRHRDRELDLDRLTGVWYRRPTPFDFGEEMNRAERVFARNEALMGIGGILRATDCLWVNRPEADTVAELKPYQLELAKKVGLRTPRTLFTNDPDDVTRLLDRGDVRLVYKSLTGELNHYDSAVQTAVLTTEVGSDLRDSVGRVRHTMCQFQEYVPKADEVRLTVIGDTYFPVTIDSQGDDSTRTDWRAGEADIPYGAYRPLPDEVVTRTQALMAELGIVYGAVDFIVTPEGEHVFLEVNPNGQYFWQEIDLGLPMSDAMADLLMAGGPFTRGEVRQVGY